MVFLHSLNILLDSKPRVALLVLNSFSFPFTTFPNPYAKSGILEQIKQILIRVTAVRNLTVRHYTVLRYLHILISDNLGIDNMSTSY